MTVVLQSREDALLLVVMAHTEVPRDNHPGHFSTERLSTSTTVKWWTQAAATIEDVICRKCTLNPKYTNILQNI